MYREALVVIRRMGPETGKERTLHLRIHGRVQGVWYRNFTVEQANLLGLKGWVRNRKDGSVEVLICGDDQALSEMIRWCQEGPPMAKVDHIDIDDAPGFANAGFELRPTR